MTYPFLKMHGLGNDFVVMDARTVPIPISAPLIQKMAHRRCGIGFDQLVMLHPSSQADVKIAIYNADGGMVPTCGNASRCVARLMFKEQQKTTCTIETAAGILSGRLLQDDRIEVDMGKGVIEQLSIHDDHLGIGTVVYIGNPHLVFIVPNVDSISLEHYGPLLENHPFFPHKTNVEIVEIVDSTNIKMRVWERGVGITHACGSGACASVIATHHLGRTSHHATVSMKGGSLDITIQHHGHVLMTGDAMISFEGLINA
jgi:diaminopimelate epimerase